MVPHQIHTDIRELSDSLVYNFALDQEDEFIFLMCCVYTYMIKYKRWDTNFTSVQRLEMYIISWGQSEAVPVLYSHQLPIGPLCMPLSLPLYQIRALLPVLTNHWVRETEILFFYHFHVFYKHSLTYSVEILICLYYKFHVDLLIDPVLKCFFR